MSNSIATYEDIQNRTLNGKNTLSQSNTMARQGAFPLEKYSIFPNYETAVQYANGEGDFENLAYNGQIITISSDNGQTAYIIDSTAPNNLKQIDATLTAHTHNIAEITNLETRLTNLEQGSSGGGEGGVILTYTVNNKTADSSGNFVITPESIGAAAADHIHSISEINGLQQSLNEKSNIDHTHVAVQKIVVGDKELSGDVHVVGVGNVEVTQSTNSLQIGITPYTESQTESVKNNIDDNQFYKFFIGTQEEWDAFEPQLQENSNYLVFIRN